MTVRSTRWGAAWRTDQSSGHGPISRVVRYSRCGLAGHRRRAESGTSWPMGRARVCSPRVRTNRSAHAGRSCLRRQHTDPVIGPAELKPPSEPVSEVRRQVADEPRHDRRIEERPAVAGRMRPEPERTRASRGDVRRCGQKDEVLERAGRVAGLPAESRVDPRRRSARVADGPDTAWRCLKASERQFAVGAPGLPVEIAAAMLIARWLAEAVAWRGAALVRGRRRSRRPASWRW